MGVATAADCWMVGGGASQPSPSGFPQGAQVGVAAMRWLDDHNLLCLLTWQAIIFFTHSSTGIAAVRARSALMPAWRSMTEIVRGPRAGQRLWGWGGGPLSPHLGYLPEVWPVMSRNLIQVHLLGCCLVQWPGPNAET